MCTYARVDNLYCNFPSGTLQVSKDIPADLADKAAEYRESLLDAVAELDDEVMEAYLDVRPLRSHLHCMSVQGCNMSQEPRPRAGFASFTHTTGA